MRNLFIAATRNAPAVELLVTEHRLRIAGEAYPDNALSFFEPVHKALADYLAVGHSEPFEAEFELRYLNSAATMMVFKLAGLLDQAAAKGRPVRLRFLILADDEILRDLGAEMKEDYSWLDFEFVESAA
jgi:hypothetical protein